MVDIVIPLYNAKDTISKTLYSILLQENVSDLHVYLVDDASDCSYDDIISFFSGKLDLHYYRLEKNSGPGAARQYGMEQSRSPYIMFCDSDDVFYDCFSIHNLINFMGQDDYDVSLGMVIEKYDTVVNVYPVRFDVLHAKMYRRSFLEKNHICFPNFYNAEDLAFNNLVLMSGANMGFCDYDTVYAYVRRVGSLTLTEDYYPNKHIRCYMEALKWSVELAEKNKCKKKNIAKVVMDSYAYLYFYFMEDFYSPSMEFVIRGISIYDKYSSYISESVKADAIEYWMKYKDNQKYVITFDQFISFCHSREGDFQ